MGSIQKTLPNIKDLVHLKLRTLYKKISKENYESTKKFKNSNYLYY